MNANNPVDWMDTGKNLFLLLIGISTAWNGWRARKTAKTVDEVHVLVNSAMTIQKRSLAEVTAAKAAITHDPKDVLAAKEALDDYLKHVSNKSDSIVLK